MLEGKGVGTRGMDWNRVRYRSLLLRAAASKVYVYRFFISLQTGGCVPPRVEAQVSK